METCLSETYRRNLGLKTGRTKQIQHSGGKLHEDAYRSDWLILNGQFSEHCQCGDLESLEIGATLESTSYLESCQGAEFGAFAGFGDTETLLEYKLEY